MRVPVPVCLCVWVCAHVCVCLCVCVCVHRETLGAYQCRGTVSCGASAPASSVLRVKDVQTRVFPG